MTATATATTREALLQYELVDDNRTRLDLIASRMANQDDYITI